MALFLKVRGFTRGVVAPKTVESFWIIFYDPGMGPSESSREFVVADDMNPSAGRTMDSQVEMTSGDGRAEFIRLGQRKGQLQGLEAALGKAEGKVCDL